MEEIKLDVGHLPAAGHILYVVDWLGVIMIILLYHFI
jgi:hypothetical protein